MRVKRIVMLTAVVISVVAMAMLSGCSKKTPKSIAEKALKEDVSVLENFEIDVVATYEMIDYHSDKNDITQCNKDFTAKANDIQIQDITDDTILVTASISNKYYKLTKKQNINYYYTIVEDQISIDSAEILEGDMSVDTTVKFDINQFYDNREYIVNVIPDETQIGGARYEKINMSDVIDIQFDPELKQCQNSLYNTVHATVSFDTLSGEYIFFTKNGKKFNGFVDVKYANYDEKDTEQPEPKWTISVRNSLHQITVSELK